MLVNARTTFAVHSPVALATRNCTPADIKSTEQKFTNTMDQV